MINNKFLCGAAAMLITASGYADTQLSLNVKMKDSTEMSFAVSDFLRCDIEGKTLTISAQSPCQLLIDDVESLTYKDPVSLEAIETGTDVICHVAENCREVTVTGVTDGQTVSVYDMSGRCVVTVAVVRSTAHLDLRGCQAGIYMINIADIKNFKIALK